ncbi:MAG: hypothetical protein E7638_04660 [Ruminococcaceae bacterium]|nr:hypothetical protein [Oscillospiraceae bacterium]
MKDEKLVEVAQKLGFAKSTVSRTARHCSGVDAETRRLILRYMDEAGITLEKECSVYAIQPDTPNYFWGEFAKILAKADTEERIFLKQNIYTTLGDSDIVLRYLEEAEKISPPVLILSAHITPEIREILLRMKEKTTVFLLAEYDSVPYTFYIGADSYGDGYRMGECFCRRCPERTPVVVTNTESPTVCLRVKGFCDALRQFDPQRFDRIPVYDYPLVYIHCGKKQLAPSRLAAQLAEWIGGRSNCCLYIPFGTGALSLALQKAKFGEKVLCFTHDSMLTSSGSPEKGIAATMNQNVHAESREAIRAAVELITTGMCPDGKYTYIPSELYLSPTLGAEN